jgi:hypothetical protein
VFHAGAWRRLDVAPAGDETSANLVAWSWQDGVERRVVAVNLGDGAAQGHVQLTDDRPDHGGPLVFADLLNGGRYVWSPSALVSAGGFYVRLERGQSHIFAVHVSTGD